MGDKPKDDTEHLINLNPASKTMYLCESKKGWKKPGRRLKRCTFCSLKKLRQHIIIVLEMFPRSEDFWIIVLNQVNVMMVRWILS